MTAVVPRPASLIGDLESDDTTRALIAGWAAGDEHPMSVDEPTFADDIPTEARQPGGPANP